jgi:hypothetical protein
LVLSVYLFIGLAEKAWKRQELLGVCHCHSHEERNAEAPDVVSISTGCCSNMVATAAMAGSALGLTTCAKGRS